MDNLKESIIIIENGKIDFVNDTFIGNFKEEVNSFTESKLQIPFNKEKESISLKQKLKTCLSLVASKTKTYFVKIEDNKQEYKDEFLDQKIFKQQQIKEKFINDQERNEKSFSINDIIG